ncbi:MAG: N-6 DNA methylase [Leptolyngbya sp. SIO4C5]|nr:N-6 DNA methylase [Leptolyngbya sp. SIO4C5]
MTHVLFIPVKDALPPVLTVYGGACGSGGMLTESQDFIADEDGLIAAKSAVYLYGKEVNGETYAICKSDMMIKGNNRGNIKFGSTLSMDEFAGMKFDFMLSNPPYGKSYKSEQKFILDGKDILDPRFQIELTDFKGNIETVGATLRSSDGQLLFLMDMVSKMKPLTEYCEKAIGRNGDMDKNLTFCYDRTGDILYIDLCPPYAEKESEEIGDEIIARFNPESNAMENLEILFFSKRFADKPLCELPILADFKLAS